MKPNALFLVFLVLLLISGCSPQNKEISRSDINDLGLLPLPDSLKLSDGCFLLSDKTNIIFDSTIVNKNLPFLLKEKLNIIVGLELNLMNSANPIKNSIIIRQNLPEENPDAYEIKSSKKNIVINGSGESGVFYGIQTFLQLAFSSYPENKSICIPGLYIKDKPEFKWRGLHLDVSRHFFPVETVKKMIDLAAFYKMNKFHWHLTDDQGWRIEIKALPQLTQIGAWRNGTLIGHSKDTNATTDTIRYGGFYTQEQIRDVIAYAKIRQVEIIPEIEMPGHALAALASYPEYSCTGGLFEVAQKWGVFEDVFCAGKEGTFDFIETILSEVTDLFPGEYIHIGGDECPKTRWEKCPDCQRRILDEHLKDESELQSYFIQRIEKYLASKGKKLIGWDEILEGGLSKNATVMSWRGNQGGIEAAKKRHDVIMTPNKFCYFNFYQTKNTKNEPLAIGGYLPIEKVYGYCPVPPELTSQESGHILGAQANIWTEYIGTEELLEYMAFPRLCAMSETLWTNPGKKSYPGFKARLKQNLKVLDKLQINYHPMPD
jgi:hexosaminidase